jgi:hypothetical protein
MTPCLINNICKIPGQKAITLTEMLIAISFTVFLMMGVYGFYNTASQNYTSGVKGQSLQDGANIVVNKIVKGDIESGVVYRLETGNSYLIPNGVGTALYTCGGAAQIPPCNANWTSSELYYCQDNPCTPSDATARWYYLNSAGTSVMYHYPNEPNNTDLSIYTAPTGSSLVLRFVSAPSLSNVVRIDSALTSNLAANVTNLRLAASGAVTTYVLLRNHP